MTAFNFSRLVRLASAFAPGLILLVLATMTFGLAAPQRAEAAGTCTVNFGTVAYRSSNNTFVMSQSMNAAVLAACDPRYPAVDSGVASPTSGTSNGGGTWSATTNAADNTLRFTPHARWVGPDTYTMYFCNDAGCSGAGRLIATVNVTVAAPTVTLTSSLAGGAVAAPYSQTLTASGGASAHSFSVVAGSLPPGLSLGSVTTVDASTSTVVLSGTPTGGGTFNFTIRATDNSIGSGPVTVDRTYTVTIAAPTIAISPTSVPDGVQNTAYTTTTLTATGGVAPYTWSVSAGALPAGVTLSTAGVLSGAPTVGGPFSFTARATDSSTGGGPYAGARLYSFNVTSVSPTITAINPTAGPTGGGTTVTITGTNFTGVTSVVFGATAATGVVFNSATSITATSPAGSTGTVDVRVTTPGGTSATSAADQFTYVAAPTVTAISPSAGPTVGGTTVTITGSGFLAAAGTGAVKFGATTATYTINSDTQITAAAPAGSAGTVDVTVTTLGGTSATSAADQFTYVAAPTVTSLSPSNGPFSGGTTVTITGTGFSPGATVVFGATAAGAVTVNSASQITATAPAGTGTVDVRVTTAGGTSATSAGDQFTYIPAPTVTSISPTAGPTSGGTTVTITGTDFTGATAVNFGGASASGITVVNATTITATAPAGTGTVDVRVTTTGGTSATSTADQFTYVPAPIVTSVSPASGPTSGGTAVTIIGTNFSGATAVTFGGTSASGVTVVNATTITATAPSGTGTVDVRVTTVGGTSATSAADQYTYVPAPTVTSVSPASGPSSGGTTVTITGTDFTGATAVTFGGTSATGVTVVNATTITATAPAGTGTVDVRVTTGGGTSATSGADEFTYIPAPTVTSVSPTAGPATGGAAVTITGTDFTGATAVTFGGASATGVTVVNATTITATAPAGTGTVDIRVTTGGGTSATSAADQFTYVAAPTVSAISPASGPEIGGTTVTLTGTDFTGVTAVTFGATPASGFTFNSATSITATAPAGTGTVDIRVTTVGGTSATSAADQFTYIAAPTVSAISPTSGPGSGGTTVTITGADFTDATSVAFGGTAATGFTVDSASQITATSPTGTGTVDIRVTTVGGTSATSGADQFTYIPAPAVTSVSPTAGPATGGTTVTLTGADFTGVTAVTFGATPATGFTFNSATSITATAPAGTGTVDITVTTAGGISATSAADQYTYVAAPTVTSISPTAGPTSGGTTVTITGADLSGATAVSFGGTAATGFTVNSASQITATAPAGTGTVDITVTTVGGTSATSAADQYIYVPAPTVSGISPASGPETGGTTVVITGADLSDATSVTFGGTTATGFTIDSAGQITATAPAGTGTVDVRVTTIGGTSATSAADQFTYVPAPTVTSVSPTAGPATGGTTVTLTGTDLSGATAVSFGGTAATGFTVDSATQITATAPAGTGTVDVTVTTIGGSSATSAADQFTYVTAPTVTAISPAAGPETGGTTVTITGADLSGATAVTFGATPASGFTVDSANQITATAPAGTGAVDIRVTTTGGTSAASAADQFTFVAAPTANSFTFGSVVGYNAGAGAATGFDLSSQATGSPTAYAVGSATTAQGGSVSVDNSGQVSYVPPVGYRGANDSFTWTATNLGGTSAPATVTLTIGDPTLSVALPAATGTASIAYNSGGAPLTFSGGQAPYTVNSIVSALPTGMTFTPGSGVLGGTPTTSGVYTLTFSVTDSSTGAGGFTDSVSATLTVAPPPLPVGSSFTAPAVDYNAGGASTTTIDLSTHVTNSPDSYAFGSATTVGGGSVSVDAAGLVSYVPPVGFRGDDSFTFTGTNASGASTPATVTVPVNNPVLSGSLPSATGVVGEAYNSGGVPVTVNGGQAPYGSFSATGLPTGLTISTSGVISGVPTTATPATVVITVTDSSTGTGPYTDTLSLPLTIAAPTITLSSNALAAATVAQAYSDTITSTGGLAPVTFAVTTGALPPGISLSAAGALSGTPTLDGTFNFTVTATDDSGYTGSRAYAVTVGAPTIVLSPASLPDAAAGVAYSQSIVGSGGVDPVTFAVTAGALPAGVSLSAAGDLSGTPTAAGTFNFTVTATDDGGYTATQAYSLTVDAPTIDLAPASLPTANTGAAYSQALSASGGTAPYSYALTAGALPAGLSLSSSGVLSGAPTSGGSFTFTVTATDSTSGAGAPYGGSRAYTLQVDAPTITLTPAALPAADVAVAYSETVTASGGTAGYSYAVTAGALPAGLSLSSGGVLSGTPTAGGTFNFTLTATDSSTGAGPYTGSLAYSLTVGAPTLALTPATLAQASVGVAYSDAIAASGGTAPYSYAVTAGALPAGISLAADGTFSGAPTAGGTFNFTVTATDSSTGTDAPYSVDGAYALIVDAPTITVGPAVLPDGQMEAAYSQTLTASGGVAPYQYAVTAGALPAGLTLAADGALSGTPTMHGTFNFTVTATDSASGDGPYAGSQTYSLVIAVPNPPVAGAVSATVAYGSSNNPISAALSGGTATIVTVAAAPAHGTVTVSGLGFSYTPAAGYFGPDSFTYTASNDGGTSAPATVSITVGVPPAPTVSAVSGVAVAYNSTGTAIDLAGSISGVHDSIAVASAPAHGAATVSGDVVTYTPTTGYFGPDSFTYTATGPGGTSAPATVSLTVATPPPPVITPPTDPTVVPPSGGGGPTLVELGSRSEGVIDGFRITVTAQHGTATIVSSSSALAQTAGPGGPQAAESFQLAYTPAPNFMGTDSVTVVAFGPGGDSEPAVFTFQVPGKAPDLSGEAPSNGSVTFTPTSTLVGGPFEGLRITRAPGFGTATVDGLSIVFTPGAANGGATSLDYVIDLPFGSSATGRIDSVSNLVPASETLTAQTIQGVPVTVRIGGVAGGPFTAATVVSISPTSAGTATIVEAGGVYDLTFTPAGAFSGEAVVAYTLTNAFGTTAGALTVTVEARPDPGADPDVRGLATSQVTAARRFADAQIDNFQRRLQDLHDGTNGSSNGVSLNFGYNTDEDRDPRTALRRQLGQQDNRLDPGMLGDDRDRETLGLDLWSGRTSTDAGPMGVGGDRLNMAGGQPSAMGGGAVGFWTSGSIDWGRQDADGVRDSRFTTQGVTAGLDVRVTDQLIIGGGLGYGEDKTKIGDNGSTSNGHAFTGALYASWRPIDAFYIDGVLGYADLDFDSRRWVNGLAGQPDGYADGKRSGDVRFVSAAFGRVTTNGGFTSDFYARLEARDITLDGFTETGGGLASLIWDDVEQSSVSANLGAAWRWTLNSRRYGALVPSARIEWSHEFEDIGDQMVRYADWAASPSYLVPLNAWSRNSLNLDLGAEWSLTDRLMFSLGYRGALGDASTSHGAQIGVKYGW